MRAPLSIIYNFDECGFQPGQGRSRKVIGSGLACPDLAETDRGETITAVECIAADGWLMDPLFIFKSSGSNFKEAWYDGSEALPPNTGTAISPNGWISDELALCWLGYFINATAGDRLLPGEKRYLIFDGNGAHLTLEFLEKCEKYAIVPFAFLPHSTHLCQPLDGKPFLNYKQQFRLENNELSFWGGRPYGKAEFLRIIQPIRERTFHPRIIRDSFKDSAKAQRNLTRIFQHQREKLEELAMTQDSIRRIRAAQAPQRRVYTKRQVKTLSQDGILRPRDANRSIKERKEKENAAEKRRIDKAAEKAYGFKPSQLSDETIQRAKDSAKEAKDNGELFFYGLIACF
ncbi:transcriptional regulator family: Centromere protein B DNA-binding region [Penicillium cataractarum]|uniref:Transcriptional regulator family: Centromere protein B DNA-binding region n=1 Tax=Penicillium cataractarum TaxID=2100454 RepID=A0A9W9VDM4_9EURO|nr:transcriptional regulator family: Centromere protein B DNA-binding region [Penicillium cataractarum]KAJ5378278.1 transcriptional regulator family: Centromere protein B DNA-binding region [Penicillium cataractarum]